MICRRSIRWAPLAVGLLLMAGCSPSPTAQPGVPPAEVRDLRVFHAAGLTPLIDDVREEMRRGVGLNLLAEAGGSQMACRKRTELGRPCDLLLLADRGLVTELLPGVCDWRLDFATDEVVLAVGLRAPQIAAAEKDWGPVLMDKSTRLARVDENLGPIGYRTLLVWALAEARGTPGLQRLLTERCEVVVDHVSRLPPLLRRGDVDYAFVYRSTCIAHDLRYIELDPAINLGDPNMDYSTAEVTYRKLKAGAEEAVTVRGDSITWTLTVPTHDADADAALEFVQALLTTYRDRLARHGFRPLPTGHFFGPKERFAPCKAVAKYAGESP